ncbi:MAG: DUF4465 domain-containing protein [Paludibacteraceae bacterium]|nr:DUF4465 domain-containing protein [Paludibacteraceae bacterium]
MKRYIVSILAIALSGHMVAQTSLNVQKKDGSNYVISLDEFEKASFDDSEPTQPEVIVQEVEVEKIVEVIKKDTITVEVEKTVEVIKKDTVTVEVEKTVEVVKKDTVTVEVEKIVEVVKKDTVTVEVEKLVTVHDTIDKIVDKIVEIHDTINIKVTDTIKIESTIDPLVFRNDKGDLCYRVSFEDDDLIALPLTGSLTTGDEPLKWSDLIDDPQYGGMLLYGEDGYGTNCTYTFIDQFSGLMSGFQGEFTGADLSWGNAYWSGGLALSNYYNSSIEDGGYLTQLEVYSESDHGGANGSDNFLMSYGYNDVVQTAVSYDSRPYIGNMYGDFTIESLYVNNSTYLLHSVGFGDQFNTAADEETQVMFVLEGYRDAEEEESAGSVVFYLVKDGVPVTTWSKVDCSALGKCDHYRINITASEDQSGEYGLNVPAYVAIDDIVISR